MAVVSSREGFLTSLFSKASRKRRLKKGGAAPHHGFAQKKTFFQRRCPKAVEKAQSKGPDPRTGAQAGMPRAAKTRARRAAWPGASGNSGAGAARKALLQTCFNPLLPAPFCAKPACRGQRQARKALPRRPCGKKAGRCGRDGRRRETRAKGARLPQLKSVETGSSS